MEYNFILSKDDLAQLIPGNKNLDDWYASLAKFLPDNGINTPDRIAAFISQCAHESNNFTAVKENLNYRAESLMKVWPRSFPDADIAAEYAHNPEKIANRAYAGRMGNGDELSGDGFKYRGRGLIQTTGKNNYSAFAESRGLNLEDVPAYLETFDGAVDSACWYWTTNGLNELADIGDVVKITKRINGGTIGLDDRQSRYDSAIALLGGGNDQTVQA